MERIKRQLPGEASLARRTLMWVAYARQPLSAAELQHALAIEQGETDLDKENISQIDDILSVCAGLVVICEESDVVQLIHSTAQKYFDQGRNHLFPRADADMAEDCITYLSFRAFSNGACRMDDEYEGRLQSFPFYAYASRNWGHHVRDALAPLVAAVPFLKNAKLIEAASQGLLAGHNQFSLMHGYSQNFPRHMTGLHLIACFGIDSMVYELLDSYAVDIRNDEGRTPLSFSAEHGFADAAMALLNNGADVNSRDQDGKTPLAWAAYASSMNGRGHKRVVTLLMANGAKTNLADSNGSTPLALAVGGACKVATVAMCYTAPLNLVTPWAAVATSIALASFNHYNMDVILALQDEDSLVVEEQPVE